MTRAEGIELVATTLLVAAAAAAVPWLTGYMAFSWDALNHHVYLGLIAEQPRWHLDVMPASVQTYQHPYLYWPVYRLVTTVRDGALAGAMWSALQALLVAPALWCLCHRLLQRPDASAWVKAAERLAAMALALCSVVVWVAFETTTNDLLAAVPVLWALVVISHPASRSDRRAFCAAALLGVGIAAKLSNGIFVPLLAVWWWQPGVARRPLPRLLSRGAALGAGTALGFAVAYAPWGWQLWRLTGNPLHPLVVLAR